MPSCCRAALSGPVIRLTKARTVPPCALSEAGHGASHSGAEHLSALIHVSVKIGIQHS